MNLCELRNVALERKARDYTYRLRIESLAIRAGEKIALIGPSGCGKSTALDLLAMILPPSAAETFLFNAPAIRRKMWRNSGGAGAGTYGPPAAAAYRLRAANRRTPALPERAGQHDNAGRAKGMDAKAVDAGLKELAGRLGIGHLLSALPDKLSIGERAAVAIARALLPKPGARARRRAHRRAGPRDREERHAPVYGTGRRMRAGRRVARPPGWSRKTASAACAWMWTAGTAPSTPRCGGEHAFFPSSAAWP